MCLSFEPDDYKTGLKETNENGGCTIKLYYKIFEILSGSLIRFTSASVYRQRYPCPQNRTDTQKFVYGKKKKRLE